MKKIFTILAAALFAGSLFAADEVLFSWTPKTGLSNADIPAGTYTLPGEWLTSVTGGTAEMVVPADKNMRIRNSQLAFNSNSSYFHITLNEALQADDQILIKSSGNTNDLWFSIEATRPKDETKAAAVIVQGTTYKIGLGNALIGQTEFYVWRAGSTTQVGEFTITRPEQKQVISTTEELINAKVNGKALEEGKLNDLKFGYLATLDDYFITAPVVTFVKRVETTYDDKSTEVDTVDVVVTAIESLEYSGMWQASFTLGETTYSVIAGIAEAYTVTYKMIDDDEEIVLGTELVAVGDSPKEYAQYEVRPLATFTGWFDELYLEEIDMTLVVVNSDMSFYADFEKAFAQSIDFEQMVLNQGKSYDVKTALDANFYDYKDIDALDSLNNEKGAARNEPYLGLKIKKKGGYIACNVLPGTTIRIKFGYVAETVLAIAGGDTLRLAPTNNKIADQVFPIMVETLVKLQTTSDKTVVIKQIKVDEPIVTWMYPITYEAAEHGKVEGWTIAFPFEEVTITATPDEGYKINDVKVNDESLNAVEGVYKFQMPAENVTVSATFEESATAVENTEAGAKAVKMVRDGQVRIVRDGKIFNVLGTEIK